METMVVDAKDEVESFISRVSECETPEEPQVKDFPGVYTAKAPVLWSLWYKRYVSAFLSVILFFTVMLVSETLSPFAQDMSAQYGFSDTGINVAISTFSVSFCLGPLLWSPLSEKYGRRPILLAGFNGFTILQMCAAVSNNAATIIITRLLGAFFASACLPLAPAITVDIWDAGTRELEIGSYVINSLAPSSGAILGAMLAKMGVDWHGACWVLAFIAALCTALIALTFWETYRPAVQREVEARLVECTTPNPDKEASSADSYAPLATVQIPGSRETITLRQALAKPYRLLYHEPLLLGSTIYTAVIAWCVHVFMKVSQVAFSMYPLATQLGANTCIFVGCIIAVVMHNLLLYPRVVLPKAPKLATERVPPELRLYLTMCAAPFFPLGLFWFGWTVSPHVNIAVPMVASVFFGASALLLLQTMLNYIIDIYESTAATALAWYIVLTYTLVTIFSAHSAQMFRTLGPRWIMTLTGCIAVTLIPVPILLRRYGPALRARSRFSQ